MPCDNIAVVGMAVQYAGCKNQDEFWDTLMRKEINSSPISAERLGTRYRDLHFHPQRSKYADTFCNDRYGCVDASVDNEHDLLADLARRALLDAGINLDDASTTANLRDFGIVSGCLSFPMDNLQGELLNLYQVHVENRVGAQRFRDSRPWSERPRAVSPEASDPRVYSDPASFVANQLGLGPVRYSLDAACASALYCLKLASDHLLSRSADVMLCGATCFPDPFFILSGFSTFQAMPLGGPDDNPLSVPLRQGSQGLTPGEGGAIMVLKRLEDAVRDGDRIYGTLLGTSLSNAGCGLPLSPHLPSEKSCMEDLYTSVGIDPSEVQYVECHATGTPQGDVVEVEALRHCFRGNTDHPPRMGSTKGNFGHTLVAAGFAGMAKVLLSMQHGTIPPTPGVDRSNCIDPLVVDEAIPWPYSSAQARAGKPGDELKCASLSAFGFGGTNAHCVFREHRQIAATATASPVLPEVTPGPIAIIGMDATFGTLKGLDAFEQAIYKGTDGASDLPSKRWRFLGADTDFLTAMGLDAVPRGCYVRDVDVDYKRLRSPMIPEDVLRPQQLLAVATMDRALQDAGMATGGKVAVLVGLGTDTELYRHRARVTLKERLDPAAFSPEQVQEMMDYINDCGTSTSYTSYIGNLVATRVSSQWGFTGPSFTVTEGANSVYRCLELGKFLLDTHQVDAVVVAGVDLCATAENLYLKARRSAISRQDHPRANFEASADGYFAGEGSGALVLKRQADVGSDDKVYASVAGLTCAAQPAEAVSPLLLQVHNDDNEKRVVEMVELAADSGRHAPHLANSPLSAESQLEQVSKLLAHQVPGSVAIGSVRANVGDVGYASGAASLIKTALCLHNRYLPANPQWERPVAPVSEALFTCPRSRAWLKNPGESRLAAVASASESGSCFGVLLTDEYATHESSNRLSLDDAAPKLIAIRGDTVDDIMAKVNAELALLRAHAETGSATDDDPAAAVAFTAHRLRFLRLVGETVASHGATATLCLALLTTPEKLEKELELAAKGVPRSAKAGRNWMSPSGSAFAPTPVTSDRVAFMYGEGRSPYYGVGLDLHRLWPALHERINDKTAALWENGDSWLMPRAVDADSQRAVQTAFDADQIEMFRTGIFVSICLTDYARDVLGVQPKACFGLSLGEISMLFALSRRNCGLSDQLTQRLRTSPVWSTQLAVEFQALRKLWNVPADAPVESFWQGYLVRASRAEIEKAIGPDNRFVRLLIVNDSSSALIAGKPAECLRVLERLGGRLPPMPVKQGMIGHCPEVAPYTPGIAHIHEILEIPDSPVKMYTSVTNAELRGGSNSSITEFVQKLYTRIADFPGIVDKVSRDGHDVFVEVGPNNMRSAAVSDILGKAATPHVSVALDRPSESAWTQTLKSLALLTAHRVPLHNPTLFADLYHPTFLTAIDSAMQEPPPKPNRFLRSVEVNGYFCPDGISKQVAAASAKPSTHCMVRLHPAKAVVVAAAGAVVADSTPVVKAKQTSSSLLVGDDAFLRCYDVDWPLYMGAMAEGISSVDLVVAAAEARMLASFGAARLPMDQVELQIREIQQRTSNAFAVNLMPGPDEAATVDALLRTGVSIVEASGYTGALSADLVRYRVTGLRRTSCGASVSATHRVVAKVSRTEVAEHFLRPAPAAVLEALVAAKQITPEQAALASRVAMADDVAVEADSGGHTDNRPIHVLLPLVVAQRNRWRHLVDTPVRVGAGGGIACPRAALLAFSLGAAFVVTGSVNQLAREAGTSDAVRLLLATATYSDVAMAPGGVQVLKKQTMFAARATMLAQLQAKFGSFDAVPEPQLRKLERSVFKQSVADVWAAAREKFGVDATAASPQERMALCVRWYMSQSSRWATEATSARKADYQIWCGPAIGSFNDFVRGTKLDATAGTGEFPRVVDINQHILLGASHYRRVQQQQQDDDVEYIIV
uniref:Polyunsaturated fatty acid synthase 2 n=1 Tax=Schizochytrium sp. ATCC PTA-9695 TaxID=1927713 RepID=A0A1L6BQD4_9STRA|nr:polyunsaturated fatty acid synthase 2 [Schizochytrium sp. ATCC PTA-9695]